MKTSLQLRLPDNTHESAEIFRDTYVYSQHSMQIGSHVMATIDKWSIVSLFVVLEILWLQKLGEIYVSEHTTACTSQVGRYYMANYSVYVLAPTLLSLNFDVPKLGTQYVLYDGMKHTFQVRMIDKSQDMNTVSDTYVNINTNSCAKGTQE